MRLQTNPNPALFATMRIQAILCLLLPVLLGSSAVRIPTDDGMRLIPDVPKEVPAFANDKAERIHKFFQHANKAGYFNGTYLFFKNDSMVKGKIGFANFKTRDTLLPDDLFQLASVSKTITGTAIMTLFQEGRLTLEDSVHWYLPELKRRNLTLRHLLTHTSGLPDYFNFSDQYWPDKSRHMENGDVIRMLNKLHYTYFRKPGTIYDYCNTNFVLLSAVVEEVSHMPFRSFVRKRIFEPAGMEYSHVNYFDSVPLERYPLQGFEGGWRLIQDVPQNGTSGDKGVYSNTWEMFRFDRALRSPFFLHRAIRDEMYRPMVPTSSSGSYYAHGWRVTWINMRKWAYHNGWWKGFRTYFWRCLDDDRCFVVLTNNVAGRFMPTREMVALLED